MAPQLLYKTEKDKNCQGQRQQSQGGATEIKRHGVKQDAKEKESTTIPVDSKDNADDKSDKQPQPNGHCQGGTAKEGTKHEGSNH